MDQQQSGVSAVVLGIMQDGGLPHIGCGCSRCRIAFDNPALAGYAASLAIIDRRQERTAVWIIDATPDIKWQLEMLADYLGPHAQRRGRLRQPDGLLLTHAHLGHIGGLPQFGPEAMAVRDLPVYATPELATLLQENVLWRPAVKRLLLRLIAPRDTLTLAPGLQVTAVAVPHRDEWDAGTLAYHIAGPDKSLLYLPDIDSWDLWSEEQSFVVAADIALVDATFFSADELHGRTAVAHPLVSDTLERFKCMPGQLVLTHINHTNPILLQDSPESETVRRAGVQIAYRGLEFSL